MTMFALIQRIKRMPEDQLMGDAGMKTAGVRSLSCPAGRLLTLSYSRRS